METINKPKIFAFINAESPGWNVVVALAEDGRCLASHISSHEAWAKHDIGVTSTLKHDQYNEAFPDGWELVWVDHPNIHEGLNAAYKLNQELQKQSL